MDNWRVHCFDARLKPLWSVRPIQLHDDFSRRYRPLAFSASVVSRHRRDRSRCQQAVVVSSKYTPILKEKLVVMHECLVLVRYMLIYIYLKINIYILLLLLLLSDLGDARVIIEAVLIIETITPSILILTCIYICIR